MPLQCDALAPVYNVWDSGPPLLKRHQAAVLKRSLLCLYGPGRAIFLP